MLFAVALSLESPTLATGWAALILLGVGLIESGLVLQELLTRFDSSRLMQLVAAESLAMIHKRGGMEPNSVIAAAQPILDLIVRGAQNDDVAIVGHGMAAWRRLFAEYIKAKGQLFYSDLYIDWLFARAQELIEIYGRRSSGIVLPKLIAGTVDLGVTAAHHRQAYNEGINEGVYFSNRCLEAAVATSVGAHLSPAAGQAIVGITAIGTALLDASKVNTAGETIRSLRSLGRALSDDPYLAHWVSSGLADMVLNLGERFPDALMAEPHAEEAADAIIAISQADRTGKLGPTHFLTAPMAERSLPRLVYTTARAGGRRNRREGWTTWDSICAKFGHFTFTIPARPDVDTMVRINAANCCGGILQALLAAPHREPTLRTFRDLGSDFIALIATGDAERLHLVDVAEEVMLSAYYASTDPEATNDCLGFLDDFAKGALGWDQATQRRFGPAFRRVGAAAIVRADHDTARTMALASVPRSQRTGKGIYVPEDDFDLDGFAPFNQLQRPGVPEPNRGTDHLNREAQDDFLELERQLHPRAHQTPEE